MITWIGLLCLSGCYCEDTLPEYLPLAPRSEMASKADFYNCDNRQLLARSISCSNHPCERLSSFPSEWETTMLGPPSGTCVLQWERLKRAGTQVNKTYQDM